MFGNDEKVLQRSFEHNHTPKYELGRDASKAKKQKRFNDMDYDS